MTKQTILAQFPGGGLMAYWTEKNSVDVGDRVVIETNKGKFVVASVFQISQIPPQTAKKACRWIVQRLELERYQGKRK